MNTKHKGNIAVANAISHFSRSGHFVFLPIGDNGGEIDIIISPDGTEIQRVQCKYTSRKHNASLKRDPESRIWEVDLRKVKHRPRRRSEIVYTRDSFDFLFITTPDGDYLIDWPQFCDLKGGVAPYTLRLGKRAAHYKLPSKVVSVEAKAPKQLLLLDAS